jgi:hypothetical protein
MHECFLCMAKFLNTGSITRTVSSLTCFLDNALFFNDHLCVFFMCTGLKYQCCMCVMTPIFRASKKGYLRTFRLAICQNVKSSKYFHKNDPFVSNVADKFCLFCNKLKEKSTYVILSDFFVIFVYFRQQFSRNATFFSRK